MGPISFKSFRQYFAFTSSLHETLTGRVARRASLSVFLLLILLTTTVRIRSYFLVRRFQRVLSGMSRIQIDKTTEEELVRVVPYLVRSATEEKSGAHAGGYYYVVSSNGSDWLMHQLYFGNFGFWIPHARALKIAGWFGYRYISFYAQLFVIDGNVSRIRYEIVDEAAIPGSYTDFISVRSAHGVWGKESPTVVTPADDENPQFRVSGDDNSLHVTYTFDAPPEQVSRAFDINLSCFWSFRGCRTARDVAPLLWQYKNEIQEKAFARLRKGANANARLWKGRIGQIPYWVSAEADHSRQPGRIPRCHKIQIQPGNPRIIKHHLSIRECVITRAPTWRQSLALYR